ncbi:hypothetical protein [Oceanicola sp. D3]|nr:hypothetical protein [Oceanicola sp. D3]
MSLPPAWWAATHGMAAVTASYFALFLLGLPLASRRLPAAHAGG